MERAKSVPNIKYKTRSNTSDLCDISLNIERGNISLLNGRIHIAKAPTKVDKKWLLILILGAILFLILGGAISYSLTSWIKPLQGKGDVEPVQSQKEDDQLHVQGDAEPKWDIVI